MNDFLNDNSNKIFLSLVVCNIEGMKGTMQSVVLCPPKFFIVAQQDRHFKGRRRAAALKGIGTLNVV